MNDDFKNQLVQESENLLLQSVTIGIPKKTRTRKTIDGDVITERVEVQPSLAAAQWILDRLSPNWRDPRIPMQLELLTEQVVGFETIEYEESQKNQES